MSVVVEEANFEEGESQIRVGRMLSFLKVKTLIQICSNISFQGQKPFVRIFKHNPKIQKTAFQGIMAIEGIYLVASPATERN